MNNNIDYEIKRSFTQLLFQLVSIRRVEKLKICPTYSRNMFALYRSGIAADRSEQREVAGWRRHHARLRQNSKTRGRPWPRRPLRLRAVRRDAERSAAATCTKAKQSSRTADSNRPGHRTKAG